MLRAFGFVVLSCGVLSALDKPFHKLTFAEETGFSQSPIRIATLQTPADAETDRESKEEVEQRNHRRIESLRKPLTSIRIVASTANTVPHNVAEALLAQEESITLSSTGETVAQPNRYTVSFCHQPLYFEELNLERCGNTYGCATNVVSGFHFLTNAAMLPYRLATQRPDFVGPTRGDCQTCQEYSHDFEPFGFEPRGALIEAAAAAGFVFLMM